jgi:hypothetical protein
MRGGIDGRDEEEKRIGKVDRRGEEEDGKNRRRV